MALSPSLSESAAHLVVGPADSFAPASLRLAGALWAELSELYPEMTAPPFPPRDIVGERAVLMVASLGESAIGCGAVRSFAADDPDVAEIKRMYVAPAARRRGVAAAILRTLEAWARTRGYRVARLETGARQPEALRLYEQAGYFPIPPYGHHVDDPLAVCLEKPLAPAAENESATFPEQ